jgi:hypothetical protein
MNLKPAYWLIAMTLPAGSAGRDIGFGVVRSRRRRYFPGRLMGCLRRLHRPEAATATAAVVLRARILNHSTWQKAFGGIFPAAFGTREPPRLAVGFLRKGSGCFGERFRPSPFGLFRLTASILWRYHDTAQSKSRYDCGVGKLFRNGTAAGAWIMALALGLGASVWAEYIRPHPHLVIALGLFGALMFLFLLFVWMSGIGKDNESASLNLDLRIDVIVRHRSPGPLGYWQYGDIFMQASAHLKSPASAEVVYRLDLIRHGVVTHAREIDDMAAWLIAERDDFAIGRKGEYRNVRPLTTSLSRTAKNDGWLHFQVDLRDGEINKSRLRLTATSSHYGVVTVERRMTGPVFSPLFIQRKLV